MKITKEINPNKVIRKVFQESLEIEKSGIYLIEITARAKSWWQNHLTTFFSDDGLYLKVDEIKLDRQGANWNGNSLRNLHQTIVFIIYLEKGQHTLNLFPSHKPYLQSIKVYQLDSQKIEYIPSANNPLDHDKWAETYDLAEDVIKGVIPDPTDGSNHYYDDSIEPPSWAKNLKPKLEIENLNFFYVK